MKNLNMYEETVKWVNYLNQRKFSYRNFDTGNIFHHSVKSLHCCEAVIISSLIYSIPLSFFICYSRSWPWTCKCQLILYRHSHQYPSASHPFQYSFINSIYWRDQLNSQHVANRGSFLLLFAAFHLLQVED